MSHGSPARPVVLVSAGLAPSGEIVVRVDSGFWSKETIKTLGRLDVRYTMAVRTNTKGVAAAIAAIDEGDWRAIDYTPDGESPRGRHDLPRSTAVRAPHPPHRPSSAEVWPHWRHFGFLTDLNGDALSVDALHRAHAVVELDIRDLKEGAGLEHVPSGNFHANSAWLQCAVLAHNLIRWTTTVGQATPVDQRTVARTVRQRLIAVPAWLVNHAGAPILRGLLNWPWRHWFSQRLAELRAVQPVPG